MTRPSEKPAAKSEKAAAKPLNRDVKRLRRRVGKLSGLTGKKRLAGICDIIDLKGYSLAVLLRELPNLPPDVQKLVAQKIEDFLYFHPERGRRLLARLAATLAVCHPGTRSHLIAALADVKADIGGRQEVPAHIGPMLIDMLQAEIDFVRKSKCVELLSGVEGVGHIPLLIDTLLQTFPKIDGHEYFHCAETLLFALKRIGGDGFLRLMINLQSPGAMSQFKLEWRHRAREESVEALRALENLDEGAAQVLLGVIDLSAHNVSFIAMIQEGLKHTDKWVRQTATSAMAKVVGRSGYEQITAMLGDPAHEVRMMAVSSLGNFPASHSGELLERLAGQEGESIDVRLNALYALHSQKNALALKQLGEALSGSLGVNARGLASLLMPAGDGLEELIKVFPRATPTEMLEYVHYLMELARPADLKPLMKLFAVLKDDERRSVFCDFLTKFIAGKAGPNLDKALETLSAAERRVIEGLHYIQASSLVDEPEDHS